MSDTLREAMREALTLIQDMVAQHCFEQRRGEFLTYESGFISVNAEAMDFLVEHGAAEFVGEASGRFAEVILKTPPS